MKKNVLKKQRLCNMYLYLISDWFLDYIKSSLNSIKRKQTKKKKSPKIFEPQLHQRRDMDDKQVKRS